MKNIVLVGICCLLFVGCANDNKNIIPPPAGLRPCCAFGSNLKAELLGMPIPFIQVSNMLDEDELGRHIYNDGKQFAITKLLGLSDEKNGLAYTEKGGFIDTAHVRDTADYTFYLYKQMPYFLNTGKSLILPQELRIREFYFPKNNVPLPNKSDQIKLAGLMAFRIAQWHEIAQWYGYESEPGFSEKVSAFSPEDLYSNMLGASLAMHILEKYPDMDQEEFSRVITNKLRKTLKNLKVVEEDEAIKKINSLNGVWWDKYKRLPDKWLVLKRDYKLSLIVKPNITDNGVELSLSDKLSNGQLAEKWVKFRLVLTKNDDNFKQLPRDIYKPVFTPEDFQSLATYAEKFDAKCLVNYPKIGKGC